MEVLSLDQQKKAILYAPKDLLWQILEEEKAWLDIFKTLPDEYFDSFLSTLRRLSISDEDKIRSHAETYIRTKARHDHLQKALVVAWNPSDLEDATSWLKEQGFLGRPLAPINLAASYRSIIGEAAAVPKATRARYVRVAGGDGPKVGKPPANASKESIKVWNSVMRNPTKRRIIRKPKAVGDQWALAVKFWLKECANKKVPAYKSEAGSSSSSVHSANMISRAMEDLSRGLAFAGYSMSRPASRKFKELWRQLERDDVALSKWKSIRPKRRIK